MLWSTARCARQLNGSRVCNVFPCTRIKEMLIARHTYVVFCLFVSVCALAFTPVRFMFSFDYLGDMNLVFAGLYQTAQHAGYLGLDGIMGPMFFGALTVLPFVPLWVTDLPFRILAVACTIVFWGSLLSGDERTRFVTLLREEVSMGYMWHDALLTFVVCIMNNWHTDVTLLLFGGPWTCICFSKNTSKFPPWAFLVAAAISTIIVVPTMSLFVRPNGMLQVGGYTTDSIAGTTCSWAFILCWIKVLTLAARAAYLTFRERPVFASVFLVITLYSVFLYFSAAWGMYLAYVSYSCLSRVY